MSASLLRALVDTTEQDVRACLHSLQFLHGFRSALTPEIMSKIAIGQKDSQRGLFDLWDSVLLARSRSKRGQNRGSEGQDNTASFLHFSRAFAECHDTNRAIQGIHHNMLAVRFSDPTLCKMVQCSRWISDSDLFLDRAGQYVPSAASAVRQLLGQRSMGGTKLEFPRQHAQLRVEREKMQNVLQAFSDGRALQGARNARECALQVVSPFLRIISPQMRDVNTSLLSPAEQRTLSNLVQIMWSAKVTFKATYRPPARPTFALEPPIDTLVDFEEQPLTSSNRQLGVETMQLVARDIARESMRRAGDFTVESDGDAASGMVRGDDSDRGNKDDDQTKPDENEHEGTGETPKRRATTWLEHGGSSKGNKKIRYATAEKKTGIVFKFQAGFTNAVRRPAVLAEFL